MKQGYFYITAVFNMLSDVILILSSYSKDFPSYKSFLDFIEVVTIVIVRNHSANQ